MDDPRIHDTPPSRPAAQGCKYLASCPYYRCRRDSLRPETMELVAAYCLDRERWRHCLRFRLQEKYGVVLETTVGPV